MALTIRVETAKLKVHLERRAQYYKDKMGAGVGQDDVRRFEKAAKRFNGTAKYLSGVGFQELTWEEFKELELDEE